MNNVVEHPAKKVDNKPTKRECHGCKLCCTVSQNKEVPTAANTPCQFNNAKGGCSKFYHIDRSTGCKVFECDWIRGIVPEELYPGESGVYIVADSNRKRVHVYVDPDRPNAWQEGKMYQFLGALAHYGYLIIYAGEERQIHYLGDDPQLYRQIEMFCQRAGLVYHMPEKAMTAAIKKHYD